MKNYVHILMLTLLSFNINAQTPQGFNYQATVRNSEEALIANANVYFKFNVLQGSLSSVPVFTEIHYIATDDLGQVNLIIGEGTATEGTFSQIDWSLGNYYLGVEINTGQSYVAMSTTQLLSVPYALYAANSGNAIASTTLGSVLSTNNSANQQQIKNLLDPTEGADAVTKSYIDALSTSSGLMNFNGWDNYQVWDDNTTVQLEPNSFVYVNANQTTLVFPEAADNYGDVIYVYVMQGDNTTPLDFVLQPSGLTIAIHSGVDLESTATEEIHGQFQTGGLQTIVHVGDYWMVANFNGVFNSPTDDDDNDGYTEEQGDCDDTDANEFPGQNWYIDADGDGYPSSSVVACERPANGRLSSELSGNTNEIDCDDTDASISPGRYEIGHDGIDNNCDGEIDGFAGIYTVTESAYWNSGGYIYHWNDSTRLIESVGGNIYRHVGLAFFDDNEFYFTVDSDTNVITVLDVDLQGGDLLLNGSPIMNCNGAGGAFESIPCNDSTSKATLDEVNGEDVLEFTVGYFRGVGATREFHEVLKRGNLETTTDNDGDGFTILGGDCNDDDPSINPGVTEIFYDGIDNNCSGVDGNVYYTEENLMIDMTWAASSTVTDNYGNEIGATDLANMRLLITNVPYTGILTLEDGAGFESLAFLGTYPDGEYYIVADFFAANDISINLDFELTFNQVGVINGETHSFPAAVNTTDACVNLHYILAKITKNGQDYTIEKVGEKSTMDLANYVGTWSGEDMWGDTEVTTTLNADGILEITGIGVTFMTDANAWGETVLEQNVLLMDVDETTGSFTIEEQYYMTTEKNGDVQDLYYLSGTGTIDPCTNTMDLVYDFVQAGTSYTDWLAQYDYVFHEINVLNEN